MIAPSEFLQRSNGLATPLTAMLDLLRSPFGCFMLGEHVQHLARNGDRQLVGLVRNFESLGRTALIIIRDARREDASYDWNALSTVAIAAATIAGVGVASLQWSALHHTDEKIGRQLSLMEADQRPWLSNAVTITGLLTSDAAGLHLNADFVLKNSGKSPAIDTFVSAQVSLSGWGPQKTKDLCHQAELAMLKLSVFPGELVEQGIGVLLPESELAQYRSPPRIPLRKTFCPPSLPALHTEIP